MKYRVVLNDRAEFQLETAFRWWHEHRSPEQANRWYNEFLHALYSLQENPERLGAAREDAEFSESVRELLFGVGGSVTHRALFTIRNDIVYVFSIRHVRQDDVRPDELQG